MRIKKHNHLLLALLVSISVPLGAQAQSGGANASGAREVETILVVARKREQSILDIPASLSALSAEDLDKQGVRNLVDVGKIVPNMTVTTFGAGTPASAMPFIRGIGLQDHLILTDPGVGVYVDGVYLGRQIGQNWSLNNIERIEVLRGPQGTLWGRNSIGGSINIVTRRADEEQATRLGLELGTRGRLNANLYHSMPISEKLAISLSSTFMHRNGIGEFVNIPETSDQVGQSQDFSGRLEVLATPNDRFSIRIAFDGNAGRHGLNPYTTQILPGRDLAVKGGVTESDIAANPYDNNTAQRDLTATTNSAVGIAVTTTWQFRDNMRTKAIVSRRRSSYKAGLDDDSAERDFLSFPEFGNAVQRSIEWQIDGDIGSLDFVGGLYYFRERGSAHQPSSTFNGGPSTLILNQRVRSYAVYGGVGYSLFDRLRVSGGLRYTEDKKHADADINGGGASASGGRKWDNLSWSLDANYSLTPKISIFGAIANGYQSGTFPARPYCLFGNAECFQAGDNITAINYEVGIRGQITNWLWASASAFITDYSNLPYQISTTDGGGFSTENVIVKQRSSGAEWEGSIQIRPWLSLHTTLGVIDAEVDGTSVAPLTPEVTFAVAPELTYNMRGGGVASLRLDYSWRDQMYGEPASADPRRNTTIAARGLLNFYLSYRSPNGRHEVGFYGRNVTDERYTNAALNTDHYILNILSNDASEFGLQWRLDT